MTPNATQRKSAKSDAPPAVVVCGIYVRQSVTDPNAVCRSVDQQEVSIREYIERRRGDGWVAAPSVYCDENISGATEDRPAYQALLADVRARKLDCLVVHAVDRLSRSLASFAALLEMLEEHDVGLVSLTQAFDSRSAMGKLTLGILGSFSAYERSMIITRTRDAMAAGRRRGLFLGGHVGLGHLAMNGRLEIVPEEAAQVRVLVDYFLASGSVLGTVAEARRRGWSTKGQRSKNGVVLPGRPFNRATMRRLLSSPRIAGKTRVDGEYFDAQCEGIIDFEMFQQVQAKLALRVSRDASRSRAASPAILRSLVWCGVCQSRMTPQATERHSRIYRAYACSRYVREGSAACPGSRVVGPTLEKFVTDRIKAIGRDPDLVAETIAAAKREIEARRPTVVVEIESVATDRKRLLDERANLVAVAGAGGDAPSAIVERLAQVDRELAELVVREAGLQSERAGLDGAGFREDDLRAALAQFDDLWGAMTTQERARALQLLIERITFDGRTGDVGITFRSGAINGELRA